jgi:hypothetical protein
MSKDGGFSLVQVMVAAGLMGGIALGVMQLSKQMQTTTIMGETSIEENQLFNHISTILIDANSCNETFKDLKFGDQVESIKRVKANGEAVDVYTVGENYGNRTILLKQMTLSGKEGEEYLSLSLERIKSGYSGPRNIKKQVALKLVFAGGKVTDCFSELSNVTENSIKKSCESIGADYNADTQKCINFKINGDETQICQSGVCKPVKKYIEDMVVEVMDKSTLCVVKYNPLLGFTNTKLDLKNNKCHANKNGAVSCTINSNNTDCN